MRVLIASEKFSPSVGGVETVTRLLSEALAKQGHTVTVVTNERQKEPKQFGGEVVRRPGTIRLLREYLRSDAVILQGPVIRLGWPLLYHRRCGVMVHHMRVEDGANAATANFRATLSRRVSHAAVSHALAQALPYPVSAILPNPYDDNIFRSDAQVDRKREVLFVGRLIPEKGAFILFEALVRLSSGRVPHTVTVVGTGPERARLERFLASCPGRWDVQLAGQVTGPALARLYQGHRILVVPSVQQESFGLVVLEGIACGCAVVASDLDGLPEALGPCGRTFSSGNSRELAQTLQDLLDSTEKMAQLLAGAEQHLEKHSPSLVARRYLELLYAGNGGHESGLAW